MSFGKWIYDKRKEAGLTQGELARKAGISTSYVSTLERAQPHTVTNAQPQPAIGVVDAIAKALDADTDEARQAAGYSPKENPNEIRLNVSGLPDDVVAEIKAFAEFKRLSANAASLKWATARPISDLIDENNRKKKAG